MCQSIIRNKAYRSVAPNGLEVMHFIINSSPFMITTCALWYTVCLFLSRNDTIWSEKPRPILASIHVERKIHKQASYILV